MPKLYRNMLLGGFCLVALASTGCVSRDEYLRTEFARRKAAERADAAERDLADERSRVQALEAEREALKRELDTKTAMAETLKGENERLIAFAKKMQINMDDVLKQGMNGIEVVTVKLPPELDKALKGLAAQYPDTIEYDPQRGAVRWKSDLTFDKGSDHVKETVKQSLQAFSGIVQSAAASQFEVVVVGHTDNLPIGPITGKSHPTNWHLSVHRAIAVMFALKGFGVDYQRMGCMGYGEFRPRVPNPGRGGAEENRRVEIFLVSSKEMVPGMANTYKNPNDGSVYMKPDPEPRTKPSKTAKAALRGARDVNEEDTANP
jgi:chemotaxis protein MotB